MPRKEPRRCVKCNRFARKGSKYCFFHGGNKGAGRPPSTYSKSMKKRNIFELIDEAQKSENRQKLFDMTEDIASIQAIINSHRENVLAAAGNIELAKKYRDMAVAKKGEAVLKGFNAEMTDAEALEHLVHLANIEATEAVERLVEKKSAMIERYFKTERNKAETYTINQMGVLVSFVISVMRTEITDPAMRHRIQLKLESVPFDNILKGEEVEMNKIIEAEVVEELPEVAS